MRWRKNWVWRQSQADWGIISCCIPIGRLISWCTVGRSSSHTEVVTLNFRQNFVQDCLWLQDCDSGHLWTSLTVWHRTIVLESQPKISPRFFHIGHLLSGIAQTHTVSLYPPLDGGCYAYSSVRDFSKLIKTWEFNYHVQLQFKKKTIIMDWQLWRPISKRLE